MRQSIKGTVLTYVGAVLGFFIQFFVVTKFLLPDVIGLTKVFIEVGNLFAGFGLFGITAAGMRFFPYFRDNENNNNGFFFYFMAVPLFGTVLISFIYLLFKVPILSVFSSQSPAFGDVYYKIIPLIFILVFWQAVENYSNLNMRIAFPKGVREVCLKIFQLAGYLAYAFEYIDLMGLVTAIIASYGLCLVIDFIYVGRTSTISLKHDPSFITPELKKNYLKYTGFLMLSAVAGNIMNQLDVIMLSSVSGLYSAGVYTIAMYMANVVDMPSRSMTAISSPLAADALKNGDFEKANSLYKSVSIHQLMVSSVIFLIIWVNIDNIFTIIPNGDKFAEGKYVILFLGIAKIIATTLNFGGILIQFSKYYFWTLFITVFLTALTICSNLFFIPRLGVSGAALATLITTVVSYSYQQYLVQRKVHGNPFTSRTVIMVGIVIALRAINSLIPSLSSVSPWLDIAVRTAILLFLACGAVLKFRISPEISGMAGRVSDILKGRR